MKRLTFLLCILITLISCISASAAVTALIVSPNENLAGTQKYPVETAVGWITDGKYSSDKNFSDNSSKFFDGDTKTQIKSSDNPDGEIYASITFTWEEQVQITGIKLWFVGTDSVNIDGYEIYAANGNDNYTKIGYAQNTYASHNSRTRGLEYAISDNIYAGQLKLIVHKKAGCEAMQFSEIAVFGKACEFERENMNTKYHYEREQPFESDNDIYFSDYKCDALYEPNYYKTVTTIDDYISVIYEFDDYCQIDYIEVFGDGDGIEMMQSADGSNYFTNGYASFKKRKAKIFGAAGKNAKFLKIVVHKDDTFLLGIDHIDVYARRVYDPSEKLTEILGAPRLRCELKSNNLLYMDWTGYNGTANGAVRYNVYIDKEPLTDNNIKGKTPHKVFFGGNYAYTNVVDEKFVSCFGLEPETEYNVAVVPVGADGSYGKFVPVKIKTYDQLGSGSMSSLFCWNDYPYTESNSIEVGVNDRPDSGDYSMGDNIAKKLKLTSEMEGISRTRWYNQSFEMLNRYGANGVAFLPSNGDGSWLKNHNDYSNFVVECMNEPNFSDATFDEVTSSIKKAYEKVKSAGDKNFLAAPTIGAGDSDKEYLRGLYNSEPNLNDYYDVLDLHPYIQSFVWEPMEGIDGDKSVPEHIDKFFANIDEMRKEHNIDKPVIFSEFGWSAGFTGRKYNWWAEDISDEQKARFIPRYYIMASEHDYVKNLYLYAFQDAGYSSADPEYRFGIVDFYGKPKESYYTYYTMVKVLKDAEFVKRVANGENDGSGIIYPNYAYYFRDEKRNNNIAVCWNANNDNVNLTVESPEEITVVDSFGNSETVASGGTIVINGNVKYIISHGDIKVYNSK